MITIGEQIACIKREIGFRERVYPRWVTQGKMRQESMETELARIKAVLNTLERLELGESGKQAGEAPSGDLFGPARVRDQERERILLAIAPLLLSSIMVRVERAVRDV